MRSLDIDPTDQIAIQGFRLLDGYVLFQWDDGAVSQIREGAAEHWSKQKRGTILKGKKPAKTAKKKK